MSRASVVALLIAAEVLVAGMAIYAVGRGAAFSGMHHVDFVATPIAPIAVGARPRVVIDDAGSRVRVGPSNDELVHVRDLTQIRGAVFSNTTYSPLKVARTSDGVRIERPHADRIAIAIFGFSTQAIEVDVPQASQLDIERCSGADVNGVAGSVSVHSIDGHVTLADLQGPVDARSDDGYVSATDVRGDRLAMDATDGHLSLDNVAVTSLNATTRDGRIEAKELSVIGDATLQTDDGPVRLHLAPNADLTIDASTRDGSIAVDGKSVDSNDASQQTIHLGSGAGHMRVATADGSIHIYTNGESLDHGL